MDTTFLLELAKKAAKKAGKFQQENFTKDIKVYHKGEIDLVTEIDVQSEHIILKILSVSKLPVLAEEEAKASPQGVYWLVDPLDGTTNYSHGFPWFAVSIALMKDKKPLLGVVYNVMFQELFWAEKGKGAFLHEKPIKVSSAQKLKNSLLATGFPYNIHERPEKIMAAFQAFIVKAQGIRRAGAAALDLAYVACGRLDGFWEALLKPWDTAAGVLLVQEAGGKVSNFLGEIYDPFQKHVVASNGLIHSSMLEITSNFLPDL